VSRSLLILANDAVRKKALQWVAGAPDGTRVEFKEPKRTLPQNNRFWAMLTDIADQQEHCGRKYPTEDWKILFLHALGQEMRFIPSLDEKTFIPIGHSSSDLSVAEMTALIELMICWGAQNGVVFHEPEVATWKR
jgi:hypothetical protein